MRVATLDRFNELVDDVLRRRLIRIAHTEIDDIFAPRSRFPLQGFENAARNIVLEFGDRENLPVRIALANSVSQVTGSIGPLLGGVLSTALGYESVFIVSIVFLGIGASLIFLRIPEPRRQSG